MLELILVLVLFWRRDRVPCWPRVSWVSTADASCFSDAAADALCILFSFSSLRRRRGGGAARGVARRQEGVGAQVAALFWGLREATPEATLRGPCSRSGGGGVAAVRLLGLCVICILRLASPFLVARAWEGGLVGHDQRQVYSVTPPPPFVPCPPAARRLQVSTLPVLQKPALDVTKTSLPPPSLCKTSLISSCARPETRGPGGATLCDARRLPRARPSLGTPVAAEGRPPGPGASHSAA